MEPLLIHLVRLIFFGICMSPCFLFRETFPWRLGSIWIVEITHLMMDDFMSPNFRPTIYLMSHWGIFPFRLRVIDLHGATWSLSLTRYTPRQWSACFLFMISQESLSRAIQSDPHLSALGYHVSPSEVCLLIYESDPVMDMSDQDHVFDDGWFGTVWFSDLLLIWCHTRSYFLFD